MNKLKYRFGGEKEIISRQTGVCTKEPTKPDDMNQLSYYGATDPGRCRENNEDAYLLEMKGKCIIAAQCHRFAAAESETLQHGMCADRRSF